MVELLPIQCKAIVAWAPREPLKVETVTVAPPRKGEVRIKIEYTSVCKSDLFVWQGDPEFSSFPYVLGHEGSGIVESVGQGVTAFKPGDKVVPVFLPQCMECEYCKHPRTNLCQFFDLKRATQLDGTSRFTCKGQTIYQVFGTSTFSEYTVVSEMALVKLDDKAPLECATLLGCGLSTGLGAALNIANVQKGESVAIFGLGAVGLAVALGARMRGAKRIVGIDVDNNKFALSKVFGVNEFINPNKYKERPLHEVIMELTDGGVDYAFECIGKTDIMNEAFNSTRRGWGQAIAVGVPKSGNSLETAPLDLLHGRSWKGTLFGGWKGRDAIPKLIEQYMNGELMIDEFITHRRDSLDYMNEVFQLLLDGKCLRCVLKAQ